MQINSTQNGLLFETGCYSARLLETDPWALVIYREVQPFFRMPLFDCDNASSATLQEWWEYMQAQPSIGIPSLYFTSLTESTYEEVQPYQWQTLAQLWKTYRRDQGLEK